ncbi:MAG: hypothetical protein WCJ62_11675 [Flavobacterium sp.]
MTIYLKNINASHERIENFLNQLVRSQGWTLIKDTYTIKDATEQQYEQMVEFEGELKEEEDSIIFVKKNGL